VPEHSPTALLTHLIPTRTLSLSLTHALLMLTPPLCCKPFLMQVRKLHDTCPGEGGLLGYAQRARKLLADSAEGVNSLDGWSPSIPQGERLEPGTPQFDKFEQQGAPEIGACGFVLVAGGLGERLGYSDIKVRDIKFLTGFCRTVALIVSCACSSSHRAGSGSSICASSRSHHCCCGSDCRAGRVPCTVDICSALESIVREQAAAHYCACGGVCVVAVTALLVAAVLVSHQQYL
jgi:hypothetical protein